MFHILDSYMNRTIHPILEGTHLRYYFITKVVIYTLQITV